MIQGGGAHHEKSQRVLGYEPALCLVQLQSRTRLDQRSPSATLLHRFSLLSYMSHYRIRGFLEKEGPCPSHVVVLCRNHVWKLETIIDDRLLTPDQLLYQLQYILLKSTDPVSSIASLTTLPRSQWATVEYSCPESFHALAAGTRDAVVGDE